jgi:hypothetical protein
MDSADLSELRWLAGLEDDLERHAALLRRESRWPIPFSVYLAWDAGEAPVPRPVREAAERIAQMAAREQEEDVDRREFIKVGAAIVATAASRPTTLGSMLADLPPSLPDGSNRSQVTEANVRAIREITAALRGLDNKFGGGHAQSIVRRHLDDRVMPMVREGSYIAQTGQKLFGAASELAHLAGWMAYDLELHPLARQQLDLALQLATAAGDQAFGGEILAAMSHQAIYLGRVSEALALAKAVQNAGRKSGVTTLLAEAYVMEAHAQALRGDAKECAAFLHKAQLTFERADRSAEPEWISYLDEAYLAAKFAHCFRDLEDWRQAERFARRSLDMDNRFVRGRAFNLGLLATTYVRNDLDQACGVGLEAVDLACGLRSNRSIEYVRDLQRRLPPGREPIVGRFKEEVRERLGSI